MNVEEELGISLPPASHSSGPLGCAVTKSYKYVTLVFYGDEETPVVAYTIHEVDARRLRDALVTALAASSDSFEIKVQGSFADGVYRGGPPKREDLAEFSNRSTQGDS